MIVSDLIDCDHPSLPGHFPGSPVVAGALILQRVELGLKKAFPTARLSGLQKARFRAPLMPGQAFDIVFGDVREGRLRVEVRQADRAVFTAILVLAEGASA